MPIDWHFKANREGETPIRHCNNKQQCNNVSFWMLRSNESYSTINCTQHFVPNHSREVVHTRKHLPFLRNAPQNCAHNWPMQPHEPLWRRCQTARSSQRGCSARTAPTQRRCSVRPSSTVRLESGSWVSGLKFTQILCTYSITVVCFGWHAFLGLHGTG